MKDAQNVSKPKKYIGKRGRESVGMPNDEFYLKSPAEMRKLFADLPHALETTQAIADACESYELERDVLLPAFEIPDEFVHAEDAGRRQTWGKRLPAAPDLRRRQKRTPRSPTKSVSASISNSRPSNAPATPATSSLCRTSPPPPARWARAWDRAGDRPGSAMAYCVGITNVDD